MLPDTPHFIKGPQPVDFALNVYIWRREDLGTVTPRGAKVSYGLASKAPSQIKNEIAPQQNRPVKCCINFSRSNSQSF